MTQSVELLLDPAGDTLVRGQWSALADAGLPTEQRAPAKASPSHRPHVTLYAGDAIPPSAEGELPGLLAGLPLPVLLGALTLFGPHREGYVLVHPVVATSALLDLQAEVAQRCGADRDGHFGPGRWTPHVTVARRLAASQVGAALDVLAGVPAAGRPVRLAVGRRWDSVARQDWLL